MSARIGLVGGSFDPPHLGHLFLIASLKWRCEPQAIWLLPVARHPFDKALNPFATRFALAQIAARLSGPSVEAHDTEARLVAAGGDGTSAALLRHLKAEQPDTEFIFALGADAWAQRTAWKDFQTLEALSTIAIFNRAGTGLVAGAGPALPDVSSTELRRRLAAGEGISELVPAEIERYIRGRGLYLPSSA